MGEEKGERNERKREDRHGRAMKLRVPLVTKAIKSICCVVYSRRGGGGGEHGPVNKQDNNWMSLAGVGRYSGMKYNNTFSNNKSQLTRQLKSR